jgi:purine-binding chemotaxis protein CheW
MQNQSQEKKEERQILVFKVLNEELGLDISCVREVLRQQEIYRLPKTPDFIEGVINLRGHIVPLIDLRKRLRDKEAGEPGKRIIICKVNKLIVGLTVDSLKEIIALPEENIKPTPKLAAMQMEADVTSGLAKIGERIIPILDLAHIVTQKEATELSGRER